MAEAARARAAPLHPGLPDEIFIWEILLRLPPKPLLRCRAVCRAWRRVTSARDFLLAHHTRQPSLPLLFERNNTNTNDDDDDDDQDGGGYLDIMSLDHRAGVDAADQLHSLARFDTSGAFTDIEASCDGLLILCTNEGEWCLSDVAYYSVCNPATREYAPLPQLRGYCIAGMYLHPPTGEYRLLLYLDAFLEQDEPKPGAGYHLYVYALGSFDPPRDIGCPEAGEAIQVALHPVLFRGSLHWFIEKDEGESEICMIMAFDTTAELFRQMRAPDVPYAADLFEMDGVLSMASFSFARTTIDIWMMQDYDSELWAFKYRVELPVAEFTMRFGIDIYNSKLVVSSWDGDDEVLILEISGEWLLQIDMRGKLVASFHHKFLGTTLFRLQQTLVQHTFFRKIEGYVVNTWPFISLDDSVVNT